jgi:hypothetical protein
LPAARGSTGAGVRGGGADGDLAQAASTAAVTIAPRRKIRERNMLKAYLLDS